MIEGKKVWMEVEKGKYVETELPPKKNIQQDYQKYVNQQIGKIGETDGEIRRYINRCKKDGEKRKCLINPEDLFRK